MTARLCPPCDGLCNQGRACPAPTIETIYSNRTAEPCQICGGMGCAVIGHRSPTYADTEQLDGGITAAFVASMQQEAPHEPILQRALRDLHDVRAANTKLSRQLWIALGALAGSVVLNTLLITAPW